MASRSSWLPPSTCTGIVSAESSSRTRSYSCAQPVLGQVAAEEDGARRRVQRGHPAHRVGEQPLGLRVVVARRARR